MLRSARIERLPLLSCPFRAMFIATALWSLLGIALSGAAFSLGIAVPAVHGGVLVWHAHELMFGVGLAAIAGFVLTAVPEFTETPAYGARVSAAFALAWAAARLAFWLSPVLGPWPAAITEVGFALALPTLLGARLLRDPQRRHRGFLWGLAAFALVTGGFWVDALREGWPMRWVHAALDVMMILVVVSMSRISMRIVNDALDARRATAPDDALPEYRARPPRRNLAIFTIALHALAAFFAPGSAVTGWIALAAAAAVLNLLNDWHVGRALLGRWAAMLYTVYWLMALGYGWLGAARLGAPLAASGGTHLLTVGAMGLSIYAVLNIAGRMHAGRPLDTRRWTPIGALLLAGAALLRAGAGLPGAPASALVAASSLAWLASWGLVLAHLGPAWWGRRTDGGVGCEEPVEIDPLGAGAPGSACSVAVHATDR
ncbi:MAG TPA: NnrS family protein [Zeimonas sp.]|nr:NnrS family protein [Zeimonas sp.]